MQQKHHDICLHVVAHIDTLLQYIQRGIPSFTDHGPHHSRRVLEYLSSLVVQYPVTLSSEDRMILAIAAMLHDIGCIGGRKRHASRSVDIMSVSRLNTIRDLLPQESYRFLQEVIRKHSSDFNLTELKNDVLGDRRLALLCCLFRLADGLDITSNRVPPLVLQVLESLHALGPRSFKVWKSHMEVEKISLDGRNVVIQIYDRILAKSWVRKIRKEIAAINEVLVTYELPTFEVTTTIVPRPT